MNIKGYDLANSDKVERMLNGSMGSGGKLYGGVGEKAADEEKLAEYDRLGGLITKGGNKVKTGSFYDFEKKQPREKSEVVFVFKDLEGRVVNIPEGEEVPIEVKAAEIAKKQKPVKKVKKPVNED